MFVFIKIFAALFLVCFFSPFSHAENETLQPSLSSKNISFMLEKLANASSKEEATALEEKILEQWRTSSSPTTNLLLERARAACEMNHFALCMDFLESLILIEPDFTESWHMRAMLHYEAGRYHAALYDIYRVLRLEPRHFGALTGLGLVLIEKEHYDEAAQIFKRALKIHPFLEDAETHMRFVQEHLKNRLL